MNYRLALFLLVSVCCSLFAGDASHPPEIRVVVFDFGGVIGTSNKANVREFIWKSLGVSKREAAAAFKNLRRARKKGRPEKAYFFDLAKAHGHPAPDEWVKELYACMLGSIHTIPGMMELVEVLQKAGYRTAMLSNISKREAALIRKKGIYANFDPVVLSCEIKVSKPKPKSYRILLDLLKVPPAQVVFIDDKAENIRAAEKLGVYGIHFTSLKQLKSELKRLGLSLFDQPFRSAA